MAVLKVSIELRTLAVLWTHFCVDTTADLSSFMDTFALLRKQKTAITRQFYGHFSNRVDQNHKTCGPQYGHSSVVTIHLHMKCQTNCEPWQFYGHIEKKWWTLAVLRTLFQPSKKIL